MSQSLTHIHKSTQSQLNACRQNYIRQVILHGELFLSTFIQSSNEHNFLEKNTFVVMVNNKLNVTYKRLYAFYFLASCLLLCSRCKCYVNENMSYSLLMHMFDIIDKQAHAVEKQPANLGCALFSRILDGR